MSAIFFFARIVTHEEFHKAFTRALVVLSLRTLFSLPQNMAKVRTTPQNA